MLILAASVLTVSAQARRDDNQPGVQEFSQGTGKGRKQVSASDTAAQAVKAALSNKFDDAFALAQKSGNRVALDLVEWMHVSRHPRDSGNQRIMRFVKAKPHWPHVRRLEKRAESLLLAKGVTPADIAAHFAGRKPISPEGKLALARLHLAQGKKKSAITLMKSAWYDKDLSSSGQAYAWANFSRHMSTDVKAMRLWVLIHDQQTRRAVAFAKKLSKANRAAAKAARLLIRRKKAGVKAYKRLPASMKSKKALKYALTRYYRKTGNYATARAMLAPLPRGYGRDVDQEAWWIEKRLIVRYSISPADRAHWATAYKLSASHGFSSGKHMLEGEFLAGWIALRRLGNAKLAAQHFSRMARAAKSRTQSSRAQYWLGRAWLALGNSGKANAHLKNAAASPTLYYGQLSRERLGLGKKAIPVRQVKATADAKRAVNGDELVRAFNLLARGGGDHLLGQFLRPLAKRFNHASHHAAVASQIYSEAGPALSVRYAKYAGSRGYDIDNWAYPSRALPRWKTIGPPVEKAVVYGLSRQESEFHPRARSGAGARGLMQLMPGTARMVARQYKVKHSKAKLTANPSYNLMLGSAFLGDLIKRANGSYIMAFAGYNAGPGNVRKWVERNGDPRSPSIDPIDWVEAIPFTETRKYVQKVLQNVHVYRSIFSPRRVHGMTADLGRGSITAENISSGCDGKSNSIAALLKAC